jgi:hypothetical protein
LSGANAQASRVPVLAAADGEKKPRTCACKPGLSESDTGAMDVPDCDDDNRQAAMSKLQIRNWYLYGVVEAWRAAKISEGSFTSRRNERQHELQNETTTTASNPNGSPERLQSSGLL